MDYKQKYQELEKEAALRISEYNALDKELAQEVNGFFDKSLMERKNNAYKKWQEAQLNLQEFISLYVKNVNQSSK
ncbi:MAG: hypothetical protein COA32_14800 [Fluviicola sp.]|nr:MAG: hypothetical protein COA32_14800 [Fluviicola sp.]